MIHDSDMERFSKAVKVPALKRTAWSVLPALFSEIMAELYPKCKSPRTVPDGLWIESCAVYESFMLIFSSLEWHEIDTFGSSDLGRKLFWQGDYSNLLRVQLRLIRDRAKHRAQQRTEGQT